MLFNIFALIAVGFLWGATNPLIKRGSKGIVKVKSDSVIKQFFLELKYLVTNYKYVIPMALNQSGSLLYFYVLQSTELSLAVPVANSLSFMFTAVSGWILGEKLPNRRTFLGVVLVLMGTILCCLDKQSPAVD